MKELEVHDIGSAVKRHRRAYLRPWQSWAPYAELGPAELEEIVWQLCARQIHPIMCVTACWVEDDGRLVPYPKKFPAAARHLRDLPVTIACHGYTHCQVGQHRARWWASNRPAWREFTAELHPVTERRHLRDAKSILEEWCGRPVTRLVPPGDMFTSRTAQIAKDEGYAVISCRPQFVPEPCALPTISPRRIHDRELVKGGAREFY